GCSAETRRGFDLTEGRRGFPVSLSLFVAFTRRDRSRARDGCSPGLGAGRGDAGVAGGVGVATRGGQHRRSARLRGRAPAVRWGRARQDRRLLGRQRCATGGRGHVLVFPDRQGTNPSAGLLCRRQRKNAPWLEALSMPCSSPVPPPVLP